MKREKGSKCQTEHGSINKCRDDSVKEIVWDVDFPLTNNPLVMKQFAMLLLFTGLFMFLLLSFIFVVTGEFSAIPVTFVITVICIGGIGLLMLLVMLIFFNNRIRVRFTMDRKGVLMETLDKRSKSSSRLAIILGVLARSPGAAGAGMLAVSREREFTDWKGLAEVTYNQRHRTIVLRNRWRPVQMVICTPENFETVAGFISQRVDISAAAQPAAAKKNPVGKMLLRTFLIVLASAPVFALPFPFELDLFVPLVMLLFALATVWLVPLLGWVVIACAIFLSVEILLIGLEEKVSIFGGTYQNYSVLLFEDWLFLFLAFAGLVYLTVFSWRAIRGKVLPALMEE